MQIKKKIYVVGIFLLVLLAFFYPHRAHRASDKALEASCRNNLKLIWNAICSYNQDLLCVPDRLSRLIDNGYIESSNLKCPLANIYLDKQKQRRNGSDYEYIPPKSLAVDTDQEIPICYDKKDNHSNTKVSNRRNVLYIGGMVRSQVGDSLSPPEPYIARG